MACQDCLNNCEQIVPDKCVRYTGVEIPLLGICTGDTLFEIEGIIFEKLLSALDGTGIVLSEINLDNCSILLEALGTKEKTLSNLIQLLIDSHCSLRELVNTLIPKPFAFNTSCLVGLPTNPTTNDIIQASLNLLCSIQTTINTFPSTYVKVDDLESQVNQIITQYNNNNNPTGAFQNNTKMVPYVAVPYFGSLSNFDNTGKGISTGWDKIYLCNGQNGTPDIRGRVIVGAVRNVPGGSLDTAVSPTNPLNIQPVDYSIGDKFGENFHKNTVPEMPAHAHSVVDPGHDHTLPPKIHVDGDNAGGEGGTNEKAPPQTLKTNKSTTGITIGSTGGDKPHENRQPSIAGVYIMYIP